VDAGDESMSEDVVLMVQLGGVDTILYRVQSGRVQFRYIDGEHWLAEADESVSAAVLALTDMQSRANEYADLNNQQARRIAELEALRDSLVGIALQVAALPTIHEGGPDEASDVDDVICHARETLEEFVLVPTGSP
jgi:hypothetical protein